MLRFRSASRLPGRLVLRTTSPSPSVTPLLVGEALALHTLHRFAKGSPFGGAGTKCLRESFRQRLHQAAVGDDLLDKGREGFGLEGLAGGLVGDDAGVEVHMDLVACGDGVGGFGALQ